MTSLCLVCNVNDLRSTAHSYGHAFYVGFVNATDEQTLPVFPPNVIVLCCILELRRALYSIR